MESTPVPPLDFKSPLLFDCTRIGISDLLIYNFLFIQDYLKSYFPCCIKMSNSIRLYHRFPLLYVGCILLQYGVPSFIACRILITFLRCKNVRNHHVTIGIQLSQNYISVLINWKRNKTKMIINLFFLINYFGTDTVYQIYLLLKIYSS